MITATSISRTFTNRQGLKTRVLGDVSLSVTKGEFVAVMGPSGSGKSTLLYHLSGMATPDTGTILFRGTDLAAVDETARARLRLLDMGFVFQENHLLANLSLLENIILPGLLARNRQRRAVLEHGRALLDQVGLSELGDRMITEASGGQLQRIGICRALINEPAIIFGDEPTGALNSVASAEVMALLDTVHRAGTTVFVVTHDHRVASRADRILLMRDGRIVNQLEHGCAEPERAGEVVRIWLE